MTKEEIAAKWAMKYHDRLTTCIDAVLGAIDEYAGSDQFKQPRIKIPNTTYLKEIAELRECLGELVDGYESWEYELIADNRCWGPEGMNSYPKLTSELYDKMIELQGKRNEAKKLLSKTI